MGGNFGGWERNQNLCFPAQTTVQTQVLGDPNLQIGQEVGEAVKTAIQPLMSELIEAVRFQCAQEFTAFIPKMVEAVRLQCAQEFRAFIPIMVEEMKKMVCSSGGRSSPHQAESSTPRNLHLRFVGSLPETLYTFSNIQDACASLMLELCDSSGYRVEVGPESSAKVRLVVLDGDFEVDGRADWTRKEFDKNLVKPRKDKGPLLKGKSEIYLSRGVANVRDIAFTDNSKSMRNGTFRLGAELVNCEVAMEAVSKEAFTVKERRLIPHRKRLSLEDDTSRLKNIGDKKSEELAKVEVHTVKDFLQLYHTDGERLREILHTAENKFSETIKHAESWPLTKECYEYYDKREGIDLVLDCVFNIVSVTFKGHTSQPYEILSDSQKEVANQLRRHAYKKRAELPKTVMPDDQVSVPVEPVCSSSIECTNMQYASSANATTQSQGEHMVHVNSHMQYSFGHDDGYQLGPPISEIQDSNLDQLDSALWADLTLLPDEMWPELEASKSSNDHIAAYTENRQALIRGTDELETTCSRTRWKSVRAVVVMIKIVIKLSAKQGFQAPKRQRHC